MTKIIVGLYFALIVIIAVVMETRRRKKDTSSEGFSTGKNSLGYWATLGLMVGNVLGGVYVIGTPAGIASTNLGYNWVFLGYCLGWAISIFYIRFYRAAGLASGASSVGAVFGRYFGSGTQRVVSLMIFLAFAGSLSSTLIGVSSILRSLLGFSYPVSVIITIVIVLFIAIMGGMGGLARLNIVHVCFMLFSVIVLACLASYHTTGGFAAAWEAYCDLRQNTMTGGIYTTSFYLPVIIIQPFVCVVSAMTIAGAVGAKNLKTAQKAQISLPIVALIFMLCINIIGICGYFWGIDPVDSMWFDTAAELGPVPAALAAITHLSAALSSDPALILIMGSIIIRDFWLPAKEKSGDKLPSEDKLINYTRIVAIVAGAIFQLLGIFAGDIVAVVSNAYSIWAVAGLSLTAFLVWRRPNTFVMFWTMLIGTVIVGIWAFGGIFSASGSLFGIPTQTMAFIVTAVCLIVLTLIKTKPGPSEEYKLYKEDLAKLKDYANAENKGKSVAD